MVGAGIIWNTRAAAGADAYGYVSQAALWASRHLTVAEPVSYTHLTLPTIYSV